MTACSQTLKGAPLETESQQSSDHRLAFYKLKIARKESFKWESYSYCHFTQEAEEMFKSWVVMHDWREVYDAVGSNSKTEAYQNTITAAINSFFPLKQTRKKVLTSLG